MISRVAKATRVPRAISRAAKSDPRVGRAISRAAKSDQGGKSDQQTAKDLQNQVQQMATQAIQQANQHSGKSQDQQARRCESRSTKPFNSAADGQKSGQPAQQMGADKHKP